MFLRDHGVRPAKSMSNDVMIRVEGLGKRYLLGRSGSSGQYTALRDVLANTVKVRLRRWREGGIQSSTEGEEQAFWALRDVDMEVRRGEVVGIIGRNGAGKSTLLKILSRITEPTKGRITLRGRVASLLEVGTGFHPELTGRENIFLNGAILGMHRREIKTKFDEIVAFAEVERFLDTPVKRYSSGMYVRLAFAVAAHLEPEILIVDEVLAVGDAQFQKKCLGKMHDISKTEGHTVLFVSHNLDAISRLCSTGVLMQNGRSIAVGPVQTVTASYLAEGNGAMQNEWISEGRRRSEKLVFTRIAAHLSGKQPQQTLLLDVEMESLAAHALAFIDFDIVAETGVTIMQIQPSATGFISSGERQHRFGINVDLPPLVPGRYSLTAWTGSHNTATLDFVERTVAFEIAESPVEGRTFVHTPDHGYVVPRSTLRDLSKN